MKEHSLIRNTLRSSPLFAGTDEGLFEALARVSRFERYADRVLLRQAGDPPGDLMLVVTGVLEYSRTNLAGRRITVRYHGAGELGDIIAALDGRGCVFDVHTRGRTALVLIPVEPFRTLVKGAPDLLYRLALVLCDRSRYSYGLVEQLGTMPLRQRIARNLLDLADACGRPGEQGIEIDLKVSQEDLAAMLSASRQRINAEMRWFVSEGIVSTRYSRITLMDRARLEASAEDVPLPCVVAGTHGPYTMHSPYGRGSMPAHPPAGAPQSPAQALERSTANPRRVGIGVS